MGEIKYSTIREFNIGNNTAVMPYFYFQYNYVTYYLETLLFAEYSTASELTTLRRYRNVRIIFLYSWEVKMPGVKI